MKKVIGIDFGTTNSVVAFKTKNVEVLPNRENEELTRSCVGLRDNEILVGRPAFQLFGKDPQNTILSVKRLMGAAFKDDEVRKMIEESNEIRGYYKYTISQLKGGTEDSVAIVMGGKQYAPEQIGAEILKKLKRAGCHDIMFNTPTLDAEIGEKIKASTTPEELKTALENIRKAGMVPMPAFEIGLPWDSDETLSKIVAFLREVPLPSTIVRQLRPWKGTPLYEECKELGLLKRELGIDDYVNSSYPILDTLYLSREEIQTWKNKILRAAVLNPKYIIRFFLEGKRIEARHFGQILRLLLGKDALRERTLEVSTRNEE